MDSIFKLPTTSWTMSSSSMPHLAQIPLNILDAFIPGYSTISRVLLETLGFDMTLVVTTSFFVFGLIKSISFLKSQFLAFVMRFGTCEVQIASDVDTYFWVMDWLAEHGVGKNSYSLIAMPPSRHKQAVEFEQSMFLPPDTDPTRAFFSSPSSSRKSRPTQNYEPSLDLFEYFWYRKRLFIWYRQRERRQMTGPGYDMPTTLIEGRLLCLSRSTEPIKALIEEASAKYYEKGASKTIIRRPAPRQRRRDGGNPWKTAARRPSRPLKTVVLETDQKRRLILDIQEYMEPRTRKWYAERGIPYRRGYLFHGPPGTGKTSLSFALAGFFELDVYCISLAEPTITEEDLIELFDQLPEHCLVLLEDIDSAGLVSRDAQTNHYDPSQENGEQDTSSKNVARISLSSLLNVIDGVASQEGRVLIMTTNHVKSLDSALLRPGRVDVRIHFELATREHAENMFIQTFGDQNGKGAEDMESAELKNSLRDMARDFAAEIPEGVLSPAEIQGFLMSWKRNPRDAIANVKEWVDEGSHEKAISSINTEG